jgi:hypothetical protein
MGRSVKFCAGFSPSPYPSPSREREPIEHIASLTPVFSLSLWERAGVRASG